MSRKSIIAAWCALLVVSGCISGKIPDVTKRPPASPEDVLGKIALPGRDDIIRATANITVSSHEGKYSQKMALSLRIPACLRVETIPLFGPADFFLSANEEYIKVFFPGEGKFYVGRATEENLFVFLKVFLPPGDIVSLLAGLPPQITKGSLSEQVEGRLYRVDIRSGKKRRSLWVDPDDYTLTKVEDRDGGRVVSRVTFKGHVVVNEVSYPRRIMIEVQQPERVSIDIRYLDLDISSDGKGAIFDLQVPSGITPVRIDRKGTF